MNYKVIDVSKYQGNIDFGNVKESGVYGVIIRIGYRGYSSAGKIVLDPCFLQNVKMCEAVGLPWGVYFFSQAKNSAEGAEEAKFVIDTIRNNGFVPEFPIYIDSEKSTHPLGNGRADKISKADRTDAVYAFCEYVEKQNFYAGVYASTTWFSGKLDDSKLKRFNHWVAHYASKCGYVGDKGMWQYTSSAKIPGVSGKCDANECYINFPVVIHEKKLNGTTAPIPLYNVIVEGVTKGDRDAIVNLAKERSLTYNFVEV